MAALAAGDPDRQLGAIEASRAVEAADHLIAALKVPIGKPPAGRYRRPERLSLAADYSE